jgi:Cyclic nucleotide-binding domain
VPSTALDVSVASRYARSLIARPGSLVANGSMRRLEIASLLWNAGEQVYLVGLIVFAFRVGGPALVALVGILQSAPSAVAVPLLLRATGGIRTERLLRILVATRAVAILAATVLLAAGAPSWLILLAAVADSLAASLVRSTRSVLAPRLARSTEELVSSNVSISTGRSVAVLVGPLIAALLLTSRDVTATFALGSGLLALAFVVALGVHAAAPLPMPGEPRSAASSGSLASLRRLDHARAIMVVLIGQQLVRGMLPVLLVSLAAEIFRSGDQGFAVLNAAIGAGGLLGGFAAFLLVRRVRLAGSFVAGVLLFGTGFVVPGVAPLALAGILALGASGVGKAILEVTGITLLQRTVPFRQRRGVFGILETLATVSLAGGAVVGAVLVQAAGPTVATLLAGLLPVVLAIASWPILRGADAAMTMPEREIRLIRDVPMLRPLALCTVEELASGVRRETVAAGTDVVRQGDPGTTFYVIESGRLEVVVDGQRVRTLRIGDSFGEIALIRDVPRTATVRATETSELAVIDREQFLAAVLGRGDSASAAEAVIRQHLGT